MTKKKQSWHFAYNFNTKSAANVRLYPCVADVFFRPKLSIEFIICVV